MYEEKTSEGRKSKEGKGSMESERTEQKTELKGDNVVIGLDCDTPLSVVDKSVVRRYHSSLQLNSYFEKSKVCSRVS